ncbi:MFS transporter [Paenarthrobacter sp. NPDC089675]|uniref:MFS transporter n=1 Tax=Paenarthrobacter sp. NPDC089675 TaxID=3364376 RepID=UPI0038106E50
MYALYQGIQQVLIPLQVQHIDPDKKVANLAILTVVAAVTSLLALPIGGAVSDRTTGRFGRRTPWLVVTSVASAALVVVMGYQTSLVPLAITYAALWFTANFYQGAWAPILPDRVPPARRGIASSVIGFGTPLGIVAGVNYAANVPQTVAYWTIGLFLVGATLILVFGAPEGPFAGHGSVDVAVRERTPVTRRISDFFSGFRSKNFTLAFTSRFMFYLAYFVVFGYLLYTLQDRIGVENLPGNNAAMSIGILTTINTTTWIVVAACIGWISDRIGRRKIFVGIAAAGMGLAMLVPLISPTWTGMVVFSILVGGFKGAYLAVDMALMSLVLPNKTSEGRDFGLLSVATGAPQLMSGAIAGALITFAGGYDALFIFGAAAAVVGGLVVGPIKGIR